MDAQHFDNAGMVALGAACASYDFWLPLVGAMHTAAESLTFYGGAFLVLAGVAREAWRAVRWVRAR